MRDRDAMVRAFDAAEKAFGTVTMLINNAGVAHAERAVEHAGGEMAARARHQSRRGVLLGAGGGAAHARGRQQGAIVNIASVLGFGVSKGVVAYAVAKAGVVQLTKALALELAFKGVRVNAIAPGWIVTEINDDYLKGAAPR